MTVAVPAWASRAPSPAVRTAAGVGAAGLGAATLVLAFKCSRRQPTGADAAALLAGLTATLALMLISGWRSPADVIERELRQATQSPNR